MGRRLELDFTPLFRRLGKEQQEAYARGLETRRDDRDPESKEGGPLAGSLPAAVRNPKLLQVTRWGFKVHISKVGVRNFTPEAIKKRVKKLGKRKKKGETRKQKKPNAPKEQMVLTWFVRGTSHGQPARKPKGLKRLKRSEVAALIQAEAVRQIEKLQATTRRAR